MTVSYTPEVRAKLEDYLAVHELPEGLGDRGSACSIAAINLALFGELADDIPDCMSEVLGEATIILQDAMLADMRNSDRYKAWLPTAAGTGREHEQERLAVLMDWMWGTVLPQLRGLADEKGFGKEWKRMCEERTVEAACAAARTALDVTAAAHGVADAARAADAGDAARAAANAAAEAAANAAAEAAAHAAHAAAHAADAANADFWHAVDSIGLLERMTKIGED